MCDYDVIIVGGGIAGLATASALVQRGNIDKSKIVVYEKALSLKPIGAAIGLFPNGFEALKEISLRAYEKVIKSSIQHTITKMYDLDGTTLIREVEFSKLNRTSPTYLVWYLLQQYLKDDLIIEKDDNSNNNNNKNEKYEESNNNSNNNTILQMGHIVKSFSINETTGIVTVSVENRNNNNDNNNNNQTSSSSLVFNKTCRILIGADGINSTIRKELFGINATIMNYHNKVMYRGVLPLHILHDGIVGKSGISLAYQGNEKGKLFAFRETATDIVTFTAMAVFTEENDAKYQQEQLSNNDNYNENENNSSNNNNNNSTTTTTKIKTKKDHLRIIFKDFPKESVHHIIDQIPSSSIFINAVYDINVMEEWSKGPIVLLGDAAHAMTPGMGQGANQGLEDACELAYDINNLFIINSKDKDKDKDDDDDDNYEKEFQMKIIPKTLEQFWRRRIERIKSIHALSRARTEQVNQSTKTTRVYEKKVTNQFATDELYQWKPSFL